MYIMVAGTGKSSRVNTESLLDDYLFRNKDAVLLLPLFRNAPTESQIHAAQLFSDKGLEVAVVGKSGMDIGEIKKASFTEADDILGETFSLLEGQSEGVFILWNDDDPLSAAILAKCKEVGIQAFDLTNGLIPLIPAEGLKPKSEPIIPEAEDIIEDVDTESEEEYVTESDDILVGIEAIARIFARAIAEELAALIK